MTHTSTEQPEALRLAEILEAFDMAHGQNGVATETSTELRRLHARVQELEAENAHLKDAALIAIDALEASQTQRVPLSDEQIAGFDRYVAGTVNGRFARAKALVRMVEAKHGITQEKQG